MTEKNQLGQTIGDHLNDWHAPKVPSIPTIVGQYCRLERANPERHAQELFAAKSQDREHRNWTYMPYGPFNTANEYKAWMESNCVSNNPMFYTVIDHKTQKATGVASYLRIKPDSGSIEVGHIHFSPLLQGKPAATEAMYLMMDYAFSLGYRRYEWKCDALNTPSRKAAQRLGLSYEGIFRQATVYKKRNRDTAWFAAIDEEWPELKQAFQKWLDPDNFHQNGIQKSRLSELTFPVLKAIDPICTSGED